MLVEPICPFTFPLFYLAATEDKTVFCALAKWHPNGNKEQARCQQLLFGKVPRKIPGIRNCGLSFKVLGHLPIKFMKNEATFCNGQGIFLMVLHKESTQPRKNVSIKYLQATLYLSGLTYLIFHFSTLHNILESQKAAAETKSIIQCHANQFILFNLKN